MRGPRLGPWDASRRALRKAFRALDPEPSYRYGNHGFSVGLAYVLEPAILRPRVRMDPEDRREAGGEDCSWREVYAAYGCSLEFDVHEGG